MNPPTKFHTNRTKNAEVENFHYWSVWLVGLVGKNGRSLFKHLNTIWRVTKDSFTKFELDRMKIGTVSPL